MIDASALLWRLQLRGIHVGDRWQALAERWTAVADAGNYAFNDLHAMMAFVGAGRTERCRDGCWPRRSARRWRSKATTSLFLREVGYDATRAIHAFGNGRYGEAVRVAASAAQPVRIASAAATRSAT